LRFATDRSVSASEDEARFPHSSGTGRTLGISGSMRQRCRAQQLVGSLLVARAVDDPALSEEMLRDVRTTLRSGSVDRSA
jgi:hypothetical protein